MAKILLFSNSKKASFSPKQFLADLVSLAMEGMLTERSVQVCPCYYQGPPPPPLTHTHTHQENTQQQQHAHRQKQQPPPHTHTHTIWASCRSLKNGDTVHCSIAETKHLFQNSRKAFFFFLRAIFAYFLCLDMEDPGTVT